MGAELPVFHILHTNPCARKTYPKMDMFCSSRTVLHVKYEILGVQRPYFADNRVQGPLVREGIGCRVHPLEKYFARFKIFDLHKNFLKI